MAKPRHRWRVPHKPPRESEARDQPVDGRRSGPRGRPALTSGTGDGSFRRLRETLVHTGPGASATENVRGLSSALRAVDNAAARRRPSSTSAPSRPQRWSRIESMKRSKLEERRQALFTGGWLVARRSGAATARSSSRSTDWGGRRGESPALGNQAIHGCSCRESVADVGEEHLSRAIEGSREANREDAR